MSTMFIATRYQKKRSRTWEAVGRRINAVQISNVRDARCRLTACLETFLSRPSKRICATSSSVSRQGPDVGRSLHWGRFICPRCRKRIRLGKGLTKSLDRTNSIPNDDAGGRCEASGNQPRCRVPRRESGRGFLSLATALRMRTEEPSADLLHGHEPRSVPADRLC